MPGKLRDSGDWMRRLMSAGIAATAAVSVAFGCAKAPTPTLPSGLATGMLRVRALDAEPFPEGFLWGVATAGYQVEGGDTTSNWAAWARAGRLPQPIGNATDHWNRYEEDLDLAKGLGLNSYRLSLEWAKIEPVKGQFDQSVIQHYHDELAALHARGMAPMVTLQHFTYPDWLDVPDANGRPGWESERMVVEFQRFATWAATEYGSQVKWWLTLNEPNTVALVGYIAGILPPGKRNPWTHATVVANQLGAHKAAYVAIHAVDGDAQVSINPIVVHMRPDDPVYKSAPLGLDEGVVESMPYLDETDFLDKLVPPARPGASRPPGTKTYMDFTAFNYFYGTRTLELRNLSQYGKWPIYPEGIYQVAKKLYARYKLPVMVTENGMPTMSDNPRADGWTRDAYIVHHLAQLRRAVADGVPVLGYMHWTLVDNYEWGSYEPKFGLFGIDRRDPTLRRFRTSAADTYEAIIKSNRVPRALLERYAGRKN